MASLRLKSRHWIVNEDGKIIIGEGRKKILENIRKTGSINQTAKVMKMSYKAVWSKIKATEEAFQVRIVDTNRKKGSHLTKEGDELLENYIKMEKSCVQSDDRLFNKIFK